MYDLIIKNGNIIDGLGEDGYICDIAIKNGKIEKIGKITGEAEKIIDATGLTVTPGFIDSHSHSDNAIFSAPGMREKCEQGITTSIGGQCGSSSLAAISGELSNPEQFPEVAKNTKLGSNLATFVGHGTVRRVVMGTQNRAPYPEELEKMKDSVRRSIRAGALGLSTGLIYNPGTFAKTDELIELSKVCAEEGGMLASHMRNESDTLIEATEEFLSIVRASGARGVISHHKACFKHNHGKVKTTLKMIDDINREGYDVYCDVYPYTASSTSVTSRFVPKEFQANDMTIKNLQNPVTRQQIIDANIKRGDVSCIDWALVTRCKGHPEYQGKYINEIAKMMNVSDIDAALDLIIISNAACNACFFSMCEEDVETVIKHPRSMICTDSSVVTSTAPYHPRLRASFTKAIRRFVRELGSVSLPEMIRKMTSMPAHVYSLKGKGHIKEGYDADICIFDFEKLSDKADYINPHAKAEGLNFVIVGGEVVVENAEYNDKKPGRLLLRKSI